MLIPKYRCIPALDQLTITTNNPTFSDQMVKLLIKCSTALKVDSFTTHDAPFLVLESGPNQTYAAPRRYPFREQGGHIFSDLMAIRLAYYIHGVLNEVVDGSYIKAILFNHGDTRLPEDAEVDMEQNLIHAIQVIRNVYEAVAEGRLRLVDRINPNEITQLRQNLQLLGTINLAASFDERSSVVMVISHVVGFLYDIFLADHDDIRLAREYRVNFTDIIPILQNRDKVNQLVELSLLHELSKRRLEIISNYQLKVKNSDNVGIQVTSGGVVLTDETITSLIEAAVDSLRVGLVGLAGYIHSAEEFNADLPRYLSALAYEPSKINQFNKIINSCVDPRIIVNQNTLLQHNVVDLDHLETFNSESELKEFKKRFEETYSLAIASFKDMVDSFFVEVPSQLELTKKMNRAINFCSAGDTVAIRSVVFGSVWDVTRHFFENNEDFGTRYLGPIKFTRRLVDTYSDAPIAEVQEAFACPDDALFCCLTVIPTWFKFVPIVTTKTNNSLLPIQIGTRLAAVRVEHTHEYVGRAYLGGIWRILRIENYGALVGGNTGRVTTFRQLDVREIPDVDRFLPSTLACIHPVESQFVEELKDPSKASDVSTILTSFILDTEDGKEVGDSTSPTLCAHLISENYNKSNIEVIVRDVYLRMLSMSNRTAPVFVRPVVFNFGNPEDRGTLVPIRRLATRVTIPSTIEWLPFPILVAEYTHLRAGIIPRGLTGEHRNLHECLTLINSNMTHESRQLLYAEISTATGFQVDDTNIATIEAFILGRTAKGSAIILTAIPHGNQFFYTGIVYKSKILDAFKDESAINYSKVPIIPSKERLPDTAGGFQMCYTFRFTPALAASSIVMLGSHHLPPVVHTSQRLSRISDVLILALCHEGIVNPANLSLWQRALAVSCGNGSVDSIFLTQPVPHERLTAHRSVEEAKNALRDLVEPNFQLAWGAGTVRSLFINFDELLYLVSNQVISLNLTAPIRFRFNHLEMGGKLTEQCISHIDNLATMAHLREIFNLL